MTRRIHIGRKLVSYAMFTRCARPTNALHFPSYYAHTYWEVHLLKLFARVDTHEYPQVRASFYAYVRALITATRAHLLTYL